MNTAQKIVGLSIAIVLLLPLLAMQFTKEVKWSGFDFLLMGILLSCVGFGCEYLNRNIKNKKVKIITIVSILILFLLIWAELAVGIFNSPISGS